MSCLPGILFIGLIAVLGLVAIVGASRRWRWLVDPNEKSRWSPYYSQAIIKRLLGTKFLVAYTYAIGFLFVCGAVLGLVINWKLFMSCLQ